MVRSLRLFTIASFSIFAIGVGLYQLRHETAASRVKTVESYWTDTGLESQTLEDLFQSSICHSAEKHFLACINALQKAAEKTNLSLVGERKFTSLNSQKNEISEREFLSKWSRFYRKHFEDASAFDFLGSMQILKQHISKENTIITVGAGLNGFLSVVKDPHTYLVPLEYYKKVLSQNKAKSNIVGVTLARDRAGLFSIKRVLPRSLAELAGLKKFDQIVAINNRKLMGLSMNAVSELMKGPEGTRLEFSVIRKSVAMKFEIIKDSQIIPTVVGQTSDLDPRLGVISLSRFAKNTCVEFKAELEALTAKKIKGLLLDLRDNPGGQMDEAACVVSLLNGADKKVFELKYLDSSKEVESYYGPEEAIYFGPIAVLINRGSASASEIVAGTLRDYGRAVLVGERTFGKGSFQEGEVWSQNDKVALFETKGFYYLPSGQSPQLKGLIPDVEVTMKTSQQVLREEDQYYGALTAPDHMGWVVSRKAVLPQKCAQHSIARGEEIEVELAQESLFCLMAAQSEDGVR